MSSPRSVEERERRFFGGYYAEERWHPVGNRERLDRDRRAMLSAAGRRGLGRVLSIGCGNGQFERMLAPHADAVIGLDISAEAIEAARRGATSAGLANLEFRCLSVADLEWGERFDTIVCLAFLHHVPEADLPELLATIRRHLVDDGFLYTQDPSRRGMLRWLGRRLMGAGYDRYHSPDERELDPDEVASLLHAAGFGSVEIAWVDLTLIPVHYLLPRAPDFVMRWCRLVDRVFCASPLARWASGFSAVARPGALTPGGG